MGEAMPAAWRWLKIGHVQWTLDFYRPGYADIHAEPLYSEADFQRLAGREKVLMEALNKAYRELIQHDADYHYRTPVSVNNAIVDVLGERQQ